MVKIKVSDNIKSYDTKSVIKETCEYMPGLTQDFSNYMKKTEGDNFGWAYQTSKWLTELCGEDYSSDNSYNYDCTLDNTINYCVPKDVYDSKTKFIAIQEHLGGDVRGNYTNIKIYKFKDFEMFFHYLNDDELNKAA
jgi:hypothetical protein